VFESADFPGIDRGANPARRGGDQGFLAHVAAFDRHFPAGELASVRLLFFKTPRDTNLSWTTSRKAGKRIARKIFPPALHQQESKIPNVFNGFFAVKKCRCGTLIFFAGCSRV
jgi:hypothetical protein